LHRFFAPKNPHYNALFQPFKLHLFAILLSHFSKPIKSPFKPKFSAQTPFKLKFSAQSRSKRLPTQNFPLYRFQTTKEQLATDFKALRWLERNIFINQLKLDDSFDFMANPYFVMNNSDQNERIKE